MVFCYTLNVVGTASDKAFAMAQRGEAIVMEGSYQEVTSAILGKKAGKAMTWALTVYLTCSNIAFLQVRCDSVVPRLLAPSTCSFISFVFAGGGLPARRPPNQCTGATSTQPYLYQPRVCATCHCPSPSKGAFPPSLFPLWAFGVSRSIERTALRMEPLDAHRARIPFTAAAAVRTVPPRRSCRTRPSR